MKSTYQTLPFNISVRCAIIALALSLSACGVLPQQNTTPDEPISKRVAGVVNHVDTANREVEITTAKDYRVTPGQRVALHYDNRTTVEFEGKNYRPQDLEQGDRIDAVVEGDARYLSVHSITVTKSSSSGGNYEANDQHISGTLRKINTDNKKLIVDTDERGGEVKVSYNERTRVLFGDRNITISELREYDILDIQLASGDRKMLADTITVVDDRAPSQNKDQLATARGEVVLVDENRRELVIETKDRYLQSFDRGRSNDPRSSFDTRDDDRTTFFYDQDLIVEYEGKYYEPSNLERGDMIEVDYERVGDQLKAKKVLVTSNVRE